MQDREVREAPADLKDLAGKTLAGIPRKEMQQMLAKGRWTCDSNWMMALVLHAGWEAANSANLEVGKAVGKAEMHRLMRLLGLERPRNSEELIFQMSLAMECFITDDYWDYEFKRIEGNWIGIVRQCYAYTKTKSIGVEDDYRCGCFGLRAGWYQAMGIEVEERVIKCMKDGDERCEILLENIIYPAISRE